MSTLEQRRDAIIALSQEYADELMDMVASYGGDSDYLESWAEKMADDLHVAFNDAIDKRDERRTPESKAAAKADFERSMHNA
jgi:hypothetical protein